MEFDWSLFSGKNVTSDEAAESFEDPFNVRLFPDQGDIAGQSRFFCLGMTLRNRGVFSVYSTNGKQIKVLTAREMSEEEQFFYNRKVRESM